MKKQAEKRKPKQTYFELIEVRDARPLKGFMAHVVFTDNTERDIDLEPFLHGPVFEPIRTNPKMFRAMRIEGGTIAWENEADIAPETLYYGDEDPPWVQSRAKAKTQVKRSVSHSSKHAANGKRNQSRRKAPSKRKLGKAKVFAKSRA